MGKELQKPAELRSMFGSNLRNLAKEFASISELSRQLGLNRTQFNRHLSGESFPRPDVLARIYFFFKIDARVLLETVDRIRSGPDPISSGFYRFTRHSFLEADKFLIGLAYVKREN